MFPHYKAALLRKSQCLTHGWVPDTTIINLALITSFLLIQFPNRTSTKLSISAPSSLSQINILGEQVWSYHSFLKVWVPTAHELKYKLHSSSFEFFNDLKFTYFPFISLSHTKRPIKPILTSHTQILYSFCFPQIIFRSWYYFISNSTSPNPLNSVLKASSLKVFGIVTKIIFYPSFEWCYGLNICVDSKFICWVLTPNVTVLREKACEKVVEVK